MRIGRRLLGSSLILPLLLCSGCSSIKLDIDPGVYVYESGSGQASFWAGVTITVETHRHDVNRIELREFRERVGPTLGNNQILTAMMDYYSIISFEGPGLDLGGPFYIQEYRKSALRYWKYLGELVNGHSDDYIYIDIMQKRVFFQPDPIKVNLGDDEGVTGFAVFLPQ